MKKLINYFNEMKVPALLSVMVFIVGFLAIVTTIPSQGFLQVWDMGNSATSLAISRTLLNPPPNAPENLFGYIQNGELTNYLNWPKGGVYVLISWFQLFEDDSLYTARLLTALVYAFNAFLFFWLMARCNISILVSILCSILFIVLPFHLEYGKMVYADIWLLTFWLLALHVFIVKGFKGLWLITCIAICGTFFFMWYAIFILPAVLLFYFKNKWRLSLGQMLTAFFSLVIVVWLFQYLVFSSFEEAYFLNAIKPWTIFRTGLKLKLDSWEFVKMAMKRILAIGYEFFPVLVLVLLSFRWISVLDIKNSKFYRSNKLLKILAIMGVTLLLNICLLPVWYVRHPFSVAFFAVLIAGSAALLLEFLGQKLSQKKIIILGVSMIACSSILFSLLPSLSEVYKNTPPKVAQVVNFIKERNEGRKRLCTFINLPNHKGWPHAFHFGIKEQADTYIFFNDSINNFNSLPEYFQNGMDDLSHLGLNDFDRSKVIFITNSLWRPHLPVLDSISINDTYVYELKL